LESVVLLGGRTSTPHEKLQGADLFVMSSRTEGFPMALGEAMACGLACVSFDCPSGPRQLIRHDVDGWLVPDGDLDALASAMDRLIQDVETRQRLASRAMEVVSRFALPSIARAWEQVLRDAAQSHPRRTRSAGRASIEAAR
jgi:glycosyltransferase involved in cell wall biosynthesis